MTSRHQSFRKTRRCRVGFLAGMCLALVLWSTWPLARDATRALPLGSMADATVPLFNVWTIWWNADRAAHGFRAYWQAPIFYSVPDTFAFSEPQTTTLLVAPVLWLTGSRVLAYNVYLWVSLMLNGLLTVRLLRVLRVGWWTACGAGAAMLLLPIIHWQREVIQLVPVWGILWVWIALWRIRQAPRWPGGIELGLAFTATFYTCVHQTLFLALLLMVAAWVLFDRRQFHKTLAAWLTAVVVAAPLVAPIAWSLHDVARLHDFTRPVKLIAQLSALPGDYTAAHGQQWVDPGQMAARDYWRLSPGWLKMGLALVGMIYGLTRRRWWRWTIFLLLTGAVAFALSLGTNLRIGAWMPWETLMHVVPGFSQVRNASRFAFFVQMVVVLLAALGMWGLVLLRRRCFRSRVLRRLSGVALCLLGLAAVFEVRPYSVELTQVPDVRSHAGWMDFVTDNISPGRSLACLPMPPGDKAADFEDTTRWMYLGTYHGLPLVNGYSGFFPLSYFEIQDLVNASFPDEESIGQLLNRGVEFVVVRQSDVPWEPASRTFDSTTLALVYEGPSGINVYRVSRFDAAK